jgi:type I restriction enzyme S subunit
VISLDELTAARVDQDGPDANADTFVYVDISSVDNQAKRVVEPKELPRSEAPSRARQRLRAGDVLVSMTRPNLNAVAMVPQSLDGAVGSTGFHVLRANENVLPEWLFFGVQTRQFVEEMSSLVQGALYPAVRPKDIRGFRLPTPPLAAQRSVVAEIEKQFSRLDEAVANLQRVKANLRRHERSVLGAAFAGKLAVPEAEMAVQQGRPFESGAQLLERVGQSRRTPRAKASSGSSEIDSSTLPALPPGWHWAPLSAITSIKGGITVDSKRLDATARPVPYLRVANVQRGRLDLSEMKVIDAPEADIEALRLMPGDVLFNEGGDRDKLGRGWIWEGQLPECIHQNHVFRARPVSAEISSKLISWWGNTFGKDYFQREGKQTTNLASINLSKLAAFPIPVPPAEEQHRIVAEVDRRLSIVREVEAEVDANLKRAQALRQAVLAREFGAGLSEQPASNPASFAA